MIQIIMGLKGSGKTKRLINAINEAVANAQGDVVCIEYGKKLGEMFYFFELACGVSAYMLGVNPFNQPGVEFYKRNMFQLLGKPGYEI